MTGGASAVAARQGGHDKSPDPSVGPAKKDIPEGEI
jgi:hypothetical protein